MDVCGHISLSPSVEIIPFEDDSEQLKSGLSKHPYVTIPSWVNKNAVARIRALNCYEIVREMVLNGVPSSEVARQIQALGEMRDKQVESVRQEIEHFKQTLPKAEILARVNPTALERVGAHIDKTVNVIEEVNDLYVKMKKRIEIAFAREGGIGFLLPGVEKQYSVALEILSRLHEIKKDWQLSSNNEDVAKRSWAATIDWNRMYTNPEIQKVVQNPESRARLVRFVENFGKAVGVLDEDRQKKVMEAVAKRIEDKKEKVFDETKPTETG